MGWRYRKFSTPPNRRSFARQSILYKPQSLNGHRRGNHPKAASSAEKWGWGYRFSPEGDVSRINRCLQRPPRPFSVCGRQDLEALRAGGHQLQRSVCGARIVSALDETTAGDHERAGWLLAGARDSAFRLTLCIESYARPTQKKQTLTTTTASAALKLRAEDPQSTSRTRSGKKRGRPKFSRQSPKGRILCISQV